MRVTIATLLLTMNLVFGGVLLAQTASPSPTDAMTPSGAPATGLGGGN